MSTHLGYDVFIAEPIPQNTSELVPNGDRRMVSPLSITLIHGGHWFTEGHPVSLVETTARIAAKTTRPADPLIEAGACRVSPQPATTNTPDADHELNAA